MSDQFIVLDPTLEVLVPHSEFTPRSGRVHTLGLLDNGKPNSGELLQKVATLLTELYPEIEVKYYRKPGAYRPAPSALLDQLVAECDTALVGIGD